MYFDKTVHI